MSSEQGNTDQGDDKFEKSALQEASTMCYMLRDMLKY